MKNYLIDIDNEIRHYFNSFTNDNEFAINVITLLDYYAEPIVKCGVNSTRKQLDIPNISKLDDELYLKYISTFKFEYLKSLEKKIIASLSIKDKNVNFIDEFIEVIIGNCLGLFKWSQLYEYKLNNIDYVYMSTDVNSCKLCQTKSNFKIKVDDLIEDIHPYCKNIFMPFNNEQILNNKVKLLTSKLKLMIPRRYIDKQFVLINNLSNSEVLLEDGLNVENAICYEKDGIVYVNQETFSYLDYIIVNYSINKNIVNEDWWKDTYNEKIKNKYIGNNVVIYANPFISLNSEQDYISYYNESLIHYIIDPNKLKSIDIKAYNELKNNVFNNLEFTKGL